MSKPNRAYLALLCLCLFGRAISQPTTLAAGDIAFIGMNCSDNTINGPESNDDFVFVLLKAVKTGTTIYFTDFGWVSTPATEFQRGKPCGDNSGSLSDGVVKWQATTDLPYGTRVLVRSKVTPYSNVGTATGEQGTFNDATLFVSISTAGESLFAYQGTLAAPTLIAGINVNASGWDASLDRCFYSTIPSTLPSALSSGSTAFTLTFTGNVRLKSGVLLTGTPALDRAIIANKANWDLSSTALQQPAPGIILPLKLVSFTGTPSGINNMLTWKVAAETDVDGYSIESSEDGVAYRTLSFVKARNTPAGEYTFTTARASATTYYRLKVTEKDGRNWYSETVSVKSDRLQTAPTVIAKPEGVLVQANASSTASATLVSTTGATIATVTIRNGVGLLPWNNAPAGSYLVVYTNGQTKQSFKVAKLP